MAAYQQGEKRPLNIAVSDAEEPPAKRFKYSHDSAFSQGFLSFSVY
jgi:hypothetical protein